MNNDILVSVIIPCYNAAKYVEQAVRSIMEQSYKNLEILVANDCSTDETLEILKKLACEDSRIKVINNEVNLQIVKTLNKLIDLSNGKYIARMDADDISLPDRILHQVSFLEKNPQYDVCGVSAFHINENGQKIRKSLLPKKYEDIKTASLYMSPLYHPTVMIRSNVYKSNLYNETFLYAEDYELWVRLLKKGHLICNLEDRLFLYRSYKEQTSSAFRRTQIERSKSIFYTYDLIPDSVKELYLSYFFEDTNITQKYSKEFKKFVKSLITKDIEICQVLYSKIYFRNKTVDKKLRISFFWSIKMLFYIASNKILRRFE